MIRRTVGLSGASIALAVLVTACTPPPETPTTPTATAQPAGPTAPAVDPAPVTDGDVTIAYENGLRIVVKRIPGAELASMQLYIKGGALARNKQTAGIEPLALRTAVQGGTKTLDKQAFARKLSQLGSDMGSSSQNSYSSIGAKSLTEQFDATFAMMAEAFMAPAMPATEIELQRERQLAGIKNRDVTPDGKLRLMVIKAVYRGHPYENLPTGTIESVKPLTAQMLSQHLDGLRKTSRLQLVVVGDVDAAHVRQLVRSTLATLPRGNHEHKPMPKPSFAMAKAEIVNAPLPTNYVEASFMGPSWSDEDFAASILAMRILSKRVWEEVRTKRNLSYAPSARYGWSGPISRGSFYVTAVDANQAMKVMFDEARLMQTQPVGPKELAGAKSVFLTTHLMANESTNGQASWLAICDISGGDWKLARNLPDKIRAVTPQQLQAFAKKHIGKLQTVVLGPATDLDRAMLESL